VKRIRRVVKKLAEKRREIPYASCWACGMGKCGYAPPDNTCACCRADHTGLR
jgi:hypothetical protein